jgi:hypothetical protein
MNHEVDAETVEAGLDGLGVPWKRRKSGWHVPVGPRWPCEVSLAAFANTLRVEAVLASWDDCSDVEAAALELLLKRVGADCPGVRFERGERQAIAWAELPEGFSERAVLETVCRVAAGARLLSREVSALLTPEVAERYLRFFGAPGEMPPLPARM